MAQNNDTKEPLKDVIAIGWGLISTPLCAVNTLSLEDAARIFTDENPPGTEFNQWVVSSSETTPCNEFPETRRHFAVNC